MNENCKRYLIVGEGVSRKDFLKDVKKSCCILKCPDFIKLKTYIVAIAIIEGSLSLFSCVVLSM